jgi:hypothetical protein
MVKIVKTLGYPIDKGFQSHYSRTKFLFSLLSKAKKGNNQAQFVAFSTLIMGLYQNGMLINTKNINKKT